ncbi:MAG: chitobiase/beta-hexosaminidase C-terminal domain-containing protein [Duncaniella sp.]|nr:chitobiase/beta-hexosaminidase C-terminal domain-containing protein [Duncaniella sp.]
MEFIIVDSKSMNEYICKRESINNLQIKASSRGAAGYVECGRRMIDICKTLISWSNDKDSSHQLRNLLLTLNEFMRSLICYYDGFRADLEYQLSEKIKDRNLRFAKEESKAIDAIQQSKKTLATITNEIQALSKEQSRFISLIEQVQMQPGLTPDEIVEFTKEYNKELERISKMRDLKLTELNKTHKILEGATKNLERIKIASKTFAKASTKATEWLNKVPLKLVKGIKIPKALRIGGKLAGEFGIILQMISLYIDAEDVMEDMNRWQRIIDVIEAKIPCDANPYKAENLRDRILNAAWTHWGKHISILCAESTAIGCSAAGGVFLSPTWWAEMVISAAVEVSKFNHDRGSLDEITHFWSEVGQLICNKNCGLPGMPPCPDGGGNGGNGNNKPNGGEHPSGAPHDNVKTDPSGYVYEGVPTNRLEGVTTTVYYKEMVEDMYGDLHENIVKWNAEEYGQENPLITDKNGFYRWDVPQGLWQVKYEKEGYETTYSEWLPVPPPQLEVNIAMKQAVQPTIVDVRAYEDAIEFEFDKYMMPALLDTKNITVTVNGNRVEGMIQLLNEEASNESKTETFASKIRFNAEEPFNADKVTLNVSNKVESYAGVCMQDNFSKTLDIELEVRRIVCDSVATVGHGENGVITVSVLPAVASAGKYLCVKTSSPTILATYAENVKIDENGEAEIIVTGELPGSAALMFSIDGYDLSASTIVNVKQIETVATPTANIASGTSVDKGTAITLSCATSGATIYYTLDGSCPCNDTSSRMVYDGTPIILDENVTIQAIATAPEMHESEIAEFTYIVKDLSAIDEISIEEDLRIFPLPVRDKLNVKADGNIIRSVVLINVAGATVAKTSASSDYVSLDVSGLRPGIYVIIIETENKTYSRKILKVK